MVWEKEIADNIFKYKPDYVVINAGGAFVPDYKEGSKRILMYEKAVDHAQTTRSILRDVANHAGIPATKLFIPADGETIPLK